jgi:CRISPR-associated RAMP protein (TIGR02581 family)
MQTFAELKNRYVIQCTLASEAAIHVGSGEASDTADSAALRQADRALLPGSSMRGALRSLLERAVVSLRLPAKVKPCVLYAEPETLAGLNLPGVECLANDTGFPKLSAEEQERKLAGDDEVLCDLCQLFGSTVMAGRLKTLDATPAMAGGAESIFAVRHGVGINRDTHTAQEHIKYEFEVAEKGPDYSFRLEIENATERDFALLYILLMEMQQGFAVGGKKNQGLGRVRMTGYTVSYFDPQSMVEPYSLREFLVARGALKPVENRADFETQLAAYFEQVCPA